MSVMSHSSTHAALLHVLFFFNDPATTEIYTLSLHDALPIWAASTTGSSSAARCGSSRGATCRTSRSRASSSARASTRDRKSTRLNSSHVEISYAVFCLKKKKNNKSLNYYHEH